MRNIDLILEGLNDRARVLESLQSSEEEFKKKLKGLEEDIAYYILSTFNFAPYDIPKKGEDYDFSDAAEYADTLKSKLTLTKAKKIATGFVAKGVLPSMYTRLKESNFSKLVYNFDEGDYFEDDNRLQKLKVPFDRNKFENAHKNLSKSLGILEKDVEELATLQKAKNAMEFSQDYLKYYIFKDICDYSLENGYKSTLVENIF